MATKKVTKAAAAPIDHRETFVSAAVKMNESDGNPMEEKLRTLYKIQQTDTKIDKIHLLRGELPLEVQDLEDDIEGLKTRISNLQSDVKYAEESIADNKTRLAESKQLVEKYEAQHDNIHNSREYESITKEIEYQQLEQMVCEKKIKEQNLALAEKKSAIDEAKNELAYREGELAEKKSALDNIIAETAKEEEILEAEKAELAAKIDNRIISAYDRVRGNAKNHLAVVTVKRGACGGCFNQIPPQRQLDIVQGKKIIVCDYCGRILVNSAFDTEE